MCIMVLFFFSSRRRHTRWNCDWSSDVCSSDLPEKERPQGARLGAFAATLLAFFLLEMGDKTQIATVALAARYASIAAVVAGTTLGMMLADVPAVFFGERILRRVPAKTVRRVAAASFALLGAIALIDIG